MLLWRKQIFRASSSHKNSRATMRIASIIAISASLATLPTTWGFTTPSTCIRSIHHHGLVETPIPSKCLPVTPSATRPITRLFMGWGPEPIWSTGFVSQTIQACPSGSCVSLKVQVEDGSGFTLPGQYVQVRPSGCEYRLLDLASWIIVFCENGQSCYANSTTIPLVVDVNVYEGHFRCVFVLTWDVISPVWQDELYFQSDISHQSFLFKRMNSWWWREANLPSYRQCSYWNSFRSCRWRICTCSCHMGVPCEENRYVPYCVILLLIWRQISHCS